MPREDAEGRGGLDPRPAAESSITGQSLNTPAFTPEELQEIVSKLKSYQLELEIQSKEFKKAKRELEKTRNHYADLYDSAPVGYLTLNRHGHIKEANATLCRMIKVNKEELNGRKLAELIAPETLDDFYTQCRLALTTGKSQRHEVLINRVDDTFFWADMEFVLQPDGLRGIVTDISIRKETEEDLVRQADVLDTIMETTGTMLVYLDHNLNFIMANNAFLEACGYKWEELDGKNYFSFFPSRENEAIFRRVFETGEKTTFNDIPYKYPGHPGKEPNYWDWKLVPIKDGAQSVIGLGLSIVDNTERKKAEEQEAFQSKLLDTIADCVWATNTNGRIIYWGKGATTLVGWQPEEIIGMNGPEILIPEKSIPQAKQILRTVKSGLNWSGEVSIKNREGDTIPLLAQISPVIDKNGKLRGTISVGKDIADLKKIDRMKDEFIGLVSHELRTPLTIISGSLQSALSPRIDPADMYELIRNAAEGADSLGVILDNMLELSRYQAGRLHLNVEPLYIRDIARTIIDKLKGQGVRQKFLLSFPENMTLVEADPVRVELILYNLLENATKYSPPDSKIKINFRTEKEYSITSITDQGPGIPPEQQKKLFELFERLEPKSPTVGVGLGLVVCRRLAEAQNGWIKVNSKPGKGSTFIFALPIKKTRKRPA